MERRIEERTENLGRVLEQFKDAEEQDKMEPLEELLEELVEAEKRRGRMMKRGMDMMQKHQPMMDNCPMMEGMMENEEGDHEEHEEHEDH